MCGYGWGGGWHMFPFMFFLMAALCLFLFFRRGRFGCAGAPQNQADSALQDEISQLRKEIEELKKSRP